MKYRYISYLIALLTLFTACSTENDVTSGVDLPTFPGDENWKEEVMEGASVTVKGFEPGDLVSRTSLIYNGQSLVFSWKSTDWIGLYPTAKDLSSTPGATLDGLYSQSEGPHPSDDPNVYRVKPLFTQSQFNCVGSTTQTSRITNGSSTEYFWDEIVRWSAYCQYKDEDKVKDNNYIKRHFSFAGQKQGALAEVGEYFDYEDATTEEEKNLHLSRYNESETKASMHLGDFDVLISPETKWENNYINFQMRHIGAIARIYLRSIEENLVIKNIKLICDKPIFYENGFFNLISHPYDEAKKNENYGVDLDQTSTGCQIRPEGDAVNMLQLDFDETCVTKKSGNGWGPYVVAYLMMYPIKYDNTTDGKLYAYVTAYKQGEDSSKELYYVSDPLSSKTMKSGKYYQWSSAAKPDDHLPIELTATLLPWQDIVGSGIKTDLEK